MDLKTLYMGIELESPLIAGASPLWCDVDAVRRVADAGAGAVVLHSLFEEQVMRERLERQPARSPFARSYVEALAWFPEPAAFDTGPEAYVAHLAKVKAAVSIPVFGSLNSITPTGWVRYAQKIEAAGADGLELNLYYLPFAVEESSGEVEQRYVDIVSFVRQEIRIPIAVKLSPFLSAPLDMARQLDAAGANALVLFNRFFLPDVDLETLNMVHVLHLSDPAELRLRLRWLAAMHGRVRASLAATGGVFTGIDALKAIACGADAVQMTSALLEHGPEHVKQVLEEMQSWLSRHGYESLTKLRGCLSLQTQPTPGAIERGGYARLLQNWNRH